MFKNASRGDRFLKVKLEGQNYTRGPEQTKISQFDMQQKAEFLVSTRDPETISRSHRFLKRIPNVSSVNVVVIIKCC